MSSQSLLHQTLNSLLEKMSPDMRSELVRMSQIGPYGPPQPYVVRMFTAYEMCERSEHSEHNEDQQTVISNYITVLPEFLELFKNYLMYDTIVPSIVTLYLHK